MKGTITSLAVIALLALAAPAGAGSGVTYYQYLIPKHTPGTFSIYSCLGGATFKAKAQA
jgi:hypothetical protein